MALHDCQPPEGRIPKAGSDRGWVCPECEALWLPSPGEEQHDVATGDDYQDAEWVRWAPRSSAGLTEDQLDRFWSAVLEAGRDGPFDANAASLLVLQRSAGVANVVDIVAALSDLTDLGKLRALGGVPQRWEIT